MQKMRNAGIIFDSARYEKYIPIDVEISKCKRKRELEGFEKAGL